MSLKPRLLTKEERALSRRVQQVRRRRSSAVRCCLVGIVQQVVRAVRVCGRAGSRCEVGRCSAGRRVVPLPLRVCAVQQRARARIVSGARRLVRCVAWSVKGRGEQNAESGTVEGASMLSHVTAGFIRRRRKSQNRARRRAPRLSLCTIWRYNMITPKKR